MPLRLLLLLYLYMASSRYRAGSAGILIFNSGKEIKSEKTLFPVSHFTLPHMSSSLSTMSSSLTTFSPSRFRFFFISFFVMSVRGVTGVIGVNGIYGLYGVCGTPVFGCTPNTLSRRSTKVVLVGGALFMDSEYICLNGRLLELLVADVFCSDNIAGTLFFSRSVDGCISPCCLGVGGGLPGV